jgi:hypothetical protein
MRDWRYSSTTPNLDTRWSPVLSFILRLFASRERTPGTQWIKHRESAGAILDIVENRKCHDLVGNRTPVLQPFNP